MLTTNSYASSCTRLQRIFFAPLIVSMHVSRAGGALSLLFVLPATTMRNLIVGGALLAAAASAFSPPAVVISSPQSASLAERTSQERTVCFSSTIDSTDCGCGSTTTVSGSPSDQARLINPKEALSKSNVYRLDGSPVSVSNLLTDGVNLVVLTRSFG